MNGLKLTLAIAGGITLAACVICGIGTWAISPHPHARPMKSATARNDAVKTQSPTETDPDALVDYFDENEVRATDWAKGKQIAVTGEVGSISNVGSDGEAELAYYTDRKGYRPTLVLVRFDRSFRNQIAQLSPGDKVRCVGSFEKKDYHGDVILAASDMTGWVPASPAK